MKNPDSRSSLQTFFCKLVEENVSTKGLILHKDGLLASSEHEKQHDQKLIMLALILFCAKKRTVAYKVINSHQKSRKFGIYLNMGFIDMHFNSISTLGL